VVGVLIQMKLRMLGHGMRGRRAVAIVLGGLFGLVAGVFTALLAGADYGDAEVSTDIAAALVAAWTAGWLVAPVLTGGSDETLQPEHFRLLPIPPRRLAFGFLLTALVGPAPLATLIAICGLIGFGLRTGPASGVAALVAVPLQLAFAVVLSRVVLAALGAVLRSRRGRDLGVLLAALIGVLSIPVRIAVQTVGPILLYRESPTFSTVLRMLPTGWGAVAVRAAARGEWPLALGLLAGLAALVAVLVVAWSRLLVRRMTTVAAGGVGGERARRRAHRAPRRGVLPATPVGAVAAKELRLWWRDARRRVVLLSSMLVGLLVPVFSMAGTRGHGGTVVPFTALWLVAFSCLQAGNLYGLDGSALWQTLVTPGAERADVRGRQLAWLLIVGPVALAAALVAPGLSGARYAYPWVLGVAPALLGAGAGMVLLLSVYAGYALPRQGNANPFSSGANPGCARALRQLAIMALLAVAAVPPVLVVALGIGLRIPMLSWLGVPVGIGSGIVLAWWWGRLAYRRLAARGPELLAAVRPGG
jgi:ABC-2 type transport system permease protein